MVGPGPLRPLKHKLAGDLVIVEAAAEVKVLVLDDLSKKQEPTVHLGMRHASGVVAIVRLPHAHEAMSVEDAAAPRFAGHKGGPTQDQAVAAAFPLFRRKQDAERPRVCALPHVFAPMHQSHDLLDEALVLGGA